MMDQDFFFDILKLNSISLIIYLAYIELNPKITRIWLRRDSSNQFIISLKSLWGYIMYPFKEIQLWYPSMWDLNIFISIPLISVLLYGIRYYYYLIYNNLMYK